MRHRPRRLGAFEPGDPGSGANSRHCRREDLSLLTFADIQDKRVGLMAAAAIQDLLKFASRLACREAADQVCLVPLALSLA